MKVEIVIPADIADPLRRHLFQNEFEQGGFLFAQVVHGSDKMVLLVEDSHLVSQEAWEVQAEVYLQMKDAERGRIMQMARAKNLCAIDCHSHPRAGTNVWFSPSDVTGITEFAEYAKWKLDGRPFAAIVWGEDSLDAVVWAGDFSAPSTADVVRIDGDAPRCYTPTNSWFEIPRGKNRFDSYE